MKPLKPIDSIVTFPFGKRYKTGKKHKGVDFRAEVGTPFKAMVGGTVVHSGWHIVRKGYGFAFGIQIVIDNDRFPDGSPGYWALYAHLQAKGVKVGQRVEKGQVIGLTGNTGNSKAPHLHVGISTQRTWNPNAWINPQKWIDA